MALESAEAVSYEDQKAIRVRVQEFDPDGNGRPHEEDLIEGGLHADSIGDLPAVGDYLGLQVERFIPGTQSAPQFEKKGGVFKVLSRLFDMQVLENRNIILCNIVVQEEKSQAIVGRLVKD